MPNCYEAQFKTLAVDDTGVPLEHLVSCLPGIEIYQGVGCVKYLRWLKSKANEDVQIDGELWLLQYLNPQIIITNIFNTPSLFCVEKEA